MKLFTVQHASDRREAHLKQDKEIDVQAMVDEKDDVVDASLEAPSEGERTTEQPSGMPGTDAAPKTGTVGQSCPWPPRPACFNGLMTPIEAAQYLRLDETGNHTSESAVRTLNFWRDKRELKATKFARHVWYLKVELDRFLAAKTEA